MATRRTTRNCCTRGGRRRQTFTEDGLFVGLEGAALLNRRLALGVAGQALTKSKAEVDLDDASRHLEVGFAGLVERYAFLFNSPA